MIFTSSTWGLKNQVIRPTKLYSGLSSCSLMSSADPNQQGLWNHLIPKKWSNGMKWMASSTFTSTGPTQVQIKIVQFPLTNWQGKISVIYKKENLSNLQQQLWICIQYISKKLEVINSICKWKRLVGLSLYQMSLLSMSDACTEKLKWLTKLTLSTSLIWHWGSQKLKIISTR